MSPTRQKPEMTKLIPLNSQGGLPDLHKKGLGGHAGCLKLDPTVGSEDTWKGRILEIEVYKLIVLVFQERDRV